MSAARPAPLALLATAVALVVGCAERTTLHTHPLGARVSVNGRFVGVTPVVFEVARDEIPPNGFFGVMAERPGFEPTTGEFRTSICGGRVVAAVFSLGISALFKPPTCLGGDVHLVLTPLGGTPAEATEAELLQLYRSGVIDQRAYAEGIGRLQRAEAEDRPPRLVPPGPNRGRSAPRTPMAPPPPSVRPVPAGPPPRLVPPPPQ